MAALPHRDRTTRRIDVLHRVKTACRYLVNYLVVLSLLSAPWTPLTAASTARQGNSSTSANAAVQPSPSTPPLDQLSANDAVCASPDAAPATGFGHLPLSFIPNMGQTDPAVQFHGHALGGNVFFASNEVVFSLPTPTKTQTAKPTH